MPKVSALVLNWWEIHVVAETINTLLTEDDVEIIVVDNGSRDGSQDYLKYLTQRVPHEKLKTILLNENYGSSYGRNVGIELASGMDIFLIDGDIKYVKGTIPLYHDILFQEWSVERDGCRAGCVGYNDFNRVMATGTNGTQVPTEADVETPTICTLSDWFPMAWTQYGLFRGDLLRSAKFPTHGPFGTVGHGYEDDWLYHEMQKRQLRSVAVNVPLYFHDAHYSLKVMKRFNIPSRTEERGVAFQAHWGRDNGWRETLAKIAEEKRVPYANYPA